MYFRTWEALAMGAIPIVLNNSIAELYPGERALVVNDFKQVRRRRLGVRRSSSRFGRPPRSSCFEA